MPDLPPPPLSYEPAPVSAYTPPRSPLTGYVAWTVIVCVCVLIPVIRARQASATLPTTAPSAVPHTPAGPSELQLELGGKMFVGFARFFDVDRDALLNGVGLPRQTGDDKLRVAIAQAEVGQRDAAVKTLEDNDSADATALRERYTAPTPPADPGPARLSAATRGRLGWFAELADVYGRPDDDPRRAAVLKSADRAAGVFLAALTVIVAAGGVGLVMSVLAVVLIATGHVRFAMPRPAGPAQVYVEAMAVYLGGFVGSSVLIGQLMPHAPVFVQAGGLIAVVALAACWPLIRGVPLAVQRADWGVHPGRGVPREMIAGVAGYLAGLPVMAMGFVVTVTLLAYSGAQASHPIMQEAGGTWKTAVGLYLLASVFAPLSEELMFRGAFVSHLRAGVGVVLSALISGIVFAAVHPQGWAVVPVLASVGAVFAMIRQWRSSLVGSVTAHAMHNGFIVTLLVLSTF